MRELKFRIWDKGLLHMYYPDDNDTEPDLWDLKDCVEGGKLVGKNKVLMQFTGLVDKRGKGIYEGDILQGYSETLKCLMGNKLQVTYLCGMYMLGKQPLVYCINNCEVIGNICENSDLVENTNADR